ncbi:MAG: hypothetical protein JXA73_22820 [Acidobacteria bacterium]|nr:hypothetical protein [Acidobacteriota bacterium]
MAIISFETANRSLPSPTASDSTSETDVPAPHVTPELAKSAAPDASFQNEPSNDYDSEARETDSPPLSRASTTTTGIETRSASSHTMQVLGNSLLFGLAMINLFLLGAVFWKLTELSRMIAGKLEGVQENIGNSIGRAVQELLATALKPDDIRMEFARMMGDLVEKTRGSISSPVWPPAGSSKEYNITSPASDMADSVPRQDRNSYKVRTTLEAIDSYCRRRMSLDELIDWAKRFGIQWGSAYPKKGQNKLQVSFNDQQNRILVFEEGQGSAEYMFILNATVPWGSVDLRRFFEFEGPDQGPLGASETQVRSVRPGHGKLEGESEIAVISPGTVAQSLF